LPSEFRALSIENGVQISVIGRLGTIVLSGDSMLSYAGGNLDRLSQSLETQLGNLQDFVAEHTGLPWPGTSVMPKPKVTAENGLISISYVDGDKPVLTLDAINVD
jgi:tRNA A37 threonylcarbamoyltransferase TsaD